MDEVSKVVQESCFWDFKGNEDFIDNYFLMRTPFPFFFIVGAYLLFVLKLGAQLMESRPAYKLSKVLLAYNAFQVVLSAIMTYQGIVGIQEFGIIETKCLLHDKVLKKRLTTGHHLYLMAKLTELLDTVFFVLRKKWKQITFLHVYHHTSICFMAWFSLKYEPTFSLVFLGSLNSFVHVIMYSYYGLSAFPKLRKYLWWKTYITMMQMIQFLVIVLHIIWNSYTSECPKLYVLHSFIVFNLLLFFYLFTDFYIKTYKNKNNQDISIKTNGQRSQLEKENFKSDLNANDTNKQSVPNKSL